MRPVPANNARPDAATRAQAFSGALWGVISSDGTVARQSGAVKSVDIDSTGHYDVTLNRNVSGCAVSGMSGDNTLGDSSGSAFTMGYAWETTTRLDVHIYDAFSDANFNNDFSFTVTC